MKRLVYLNLFLFVIIASVYSQNGIRIENYDFPIVVFVDEAQVCTPVYSCFVSNLERGTYRIQVYNAQDFSSPRRKGKPIFSEKIRYSGQGIEDIYLTTSGRPSSSESSLCIMEPDAFKEFISTLRSANFDNARTDIINSAVLTTGFTCAQAKEIVSLYMFDNTRVAFLKKVYPSIVDKTNFFTLLNVLDFDNSKSEVAKFIEKNYNK